MSGLPEDEAGTEAVVERRRRLAEVFGDVLPDTTSDERDPESASADEPERDAWYRDQVPPHHG
jgi:hypothetical protein